MIEPNYTAADVRAYREEYECSMFEAKGYFHKKQILEIIDEFRRSADMTLLIDVIEELVNHTKFS